MKYRIIILLVISVAGLSVMKYGRGYWYPYYLKMKGKRTVAEVIDQIGVAQDIALGKMFSDAGVSYPPNKLTFLALKDTRVLEIWAQDSGNWVFVKNLDVKGASGVLGPKLREGDRQVPEGRYKITGFNPNSSYHLSMKLNYPNAFDLKWAKAEGRSAPGTNIFIHGKSGSIGCLAMGDEAIEQLFVLVERVGKGNTSVLISPTDPREGSLQVPPGAAEWVKELYKDIETEFFSVVQA